MRVVPLLVALVMVACSDESAEECTIVHNEDGTSTLVCPDGTSVNIGQTDSDAGQVDVRDDLVDGGSEEVEDLVTVDMRASDGDGEGDERDMTVDPADDQIDDSGDLAELEDLVEDLGELADAGNPEDHPCYETTGICVWMRYEAAPVRVGEEWARPQDFDLHFMDRSVGTRWDQSPEDCHWKNRTPDWGIEGDESDNPVCIHNDLTDESTNEDFEAWKPEELATLQNPTESTYSVGVFYFSDHNFGPCAVSVDVVFDGGEPETIEFVGELENRQFWWVADIAWPERTSEQPVRRLYPSGFP